MGLCTHAKILRELSEILGYQLQKDTKYVLLGIPSDIDLPRRSLVLCNLGLAVAKRDIAMRWGAAELPTLTEWRAGMDMYMGAERVTYKMRGCPKKFFKIWKSWLRYYGLELEDDQDGSTNPQGLQEELNTNDHVSVGAER